jgi:O-acetyl-ADP-ribose deacetylase (regulator of RNase III)
MEISDSVLELFVGNIPMQNTDAIVNAANSWLIFGSGVAGVIHCVAGPYLWIECKIIGESKIDKVKLTKGYNLLIL